MRVALLQAASRALERPVLCSLRTLLPVCTSAPCCVLIHSHSKLDVLIRLHLLQSGFPRKSETRTWVRKPNWEVVQGSRSDEGIDRDRVGEKADQM